MNKVYFLKNLKKLKTVSGKLFRDFFPKDSNLLIKIHFGEPGNQTALFPKDVEPIINSLKLLGIKPALIDTLVAYHSERSTIKGYERAAKKRGYGRLGEIIISNRYFGVKTKDFTAQVCKELTQAKNVLVISHVKGHPCSGFGGAIKNLGMGGVTKKTKAVEHELCKPKFVSDCLGCGVCAELCPAKAIRIVKGQAKINLNSCWGCSICELECPYNCLAPKKALFDDLLAQGAVAVIKKLPKKTYYVNIVRNITQLCDCGADSGKIIAKDLGILFSKDPIAIDRASIDLVNKAAGKDVLKEANHKDPFIQLKFASKYLKSRLKKYKLVNIN